MTTHTKSALIDAFYNGNMTGIFQMRKYSDILDSLRPDSVFTLNVMNDNIYEYFTEGKEEFKSILKDAIFRSLQARHGSSFDVRNTFRNLKIELVSEDVVKMHDLNARDHERHIVTFDCEIVAAEKEKTYIKKCTGVCPSCYTTVAIEADYDREIDEARCNNIQCKRTKLKINKTGVVTDNIQVLYLQELLSDSVESSPVMMKGIALDELSGKLHVGKKKRIVGLYKSVLKNEKENVNEITIEIISATDLEEKYTANLTESELEFLKSESKKDDFINKITTSFAPLIIGYEDIKFSILLMLVGGYSSVKRSDINLLLVGDPSLAKSELLKECSKISHKAMYTSGKGSSAAGLTIGLVKMENGNYVAQAGVLPLCDGGHACIDEFDKMSTNDRSSMHEGMEQQTVSIAKAGFRMTLEAKTSILAAANPKYGKYDSTMSLIDNIDIPVPLVSRFDLIWLIRDKVDSFEDSKKAQHILDTFTGDDKSETAFISSSLLSSYLRYVREIEPIITDEAKQKLAGIYNSMRALAAKNDSLAVGVRQLEALARMSTAHAKLLFKDKVEISDVEVVENLLKKMFESLGMKMDDSFNQTNLLIGKKETKDQLANRIWTECEDDNKCVKYTDFIKKLGKTELFDDVTAKILFARWDSMCHIKMKGGGLYQKT